MRSSPFGFLDLEVNGVGNSKRELFHPERLSLGRQLLWMISDARSDKLQLNTCRPYQFSGTIVGPVGDAVGCDAGGALLTSGVPVRGGLVAAAATPVGGARLSGAQSTAGV